MARFNSPINGALDIALRNKLCSMLYSALNTALHSYENPKAMLRRWRKLGSLAFTEVLIISSSSDWDLYPSAFWVHPWIAQNLRDSGAGEIHCFVQQWLDSQPLEAGISENPEEEDAKVQHLMKLLAALNPD